MDEQLTLDIDGIATTILTDRQTDRPAADAGRESREVKTSIEAGG